MKETYLRNIARVLSAVFTPFYVPTVGFAALFLFTYLKMLPMFYQLIVVGIVYLFTVVFPMAAIYFYQKVNGWTLRHLGDREKRVVPYVMTFISYVVCLVLMYRINIPRFMSGIIVNQYTYGGHRRIYGRSDIIQPAVLLQSGILALLCNHTGRNAGHLTHYSVAAFARRSAGGFCRRTRMRYCRNIIHITRNKHFNTYTL